jgi:M6 family metalloprotease-like protein
LIPIEFSDLRGERKFKPRVNKQMLLLSDWYSTVSGGRLKIEWVVLDKWAKLPGKQKDYLISSSVNLADAANGPKLFRDAMDAADPVFDFTGVQTVNFILPKGQTAILEGSQGFPWDEAVRNYSSDEGSIASYSIAGKYFDLPGKTYWSYWAHEFGHAIGLPHVGASRGTLPPFNPWDMMGGQDGPSRELSGWIRFLAGWLSDNQVYCKDLDSIERQNLTLVPLSSDRKGYKVAILPISKTKALIVESRRQTKFSCKTRPARDGVLVYIYEATLGHGENFLIPVAPPGRQNQQDTCNSANFQGAPPNPDYLLRAGDKVVVEGVTVEVLKHSRNDRVRFSR